MDKASEYWNLGRHIACLIRCISKLIYQTQNGDTIFNGRYRIKEHII